MRILIQLILTMLTLTLFLPKSYAIVQPKTTAIKLIEKPTDSQNEPSNKTKILANTAMIASLGGLGIAIVGLTAAASTGIAFGVGIVLSLIGLVLSIITFTRKDKNKKIKLKSWLGISGIGLIALIVLAIIWISSQQD